jgi:hypothetical protein
MVSSESRFSRTSHPASNDFSIRSVTLPEVVVLRKNQFSCSIWSELHHQPVVIFTTARTADIGGNSAFDVDQCVMKFGKHRSLTGEGRRWLLRNDFIADNEVWTSWSRSFTLGSLAESSADRAAWVEWLSKEDSPWKMVSRTYGDFWSVGATWTSSGDSWDVLFCSIFRSFSLISRRLSWMRLKCLSLIVSVICSNRCRFYCTYW